jgi:hypothetical protein
MVRQRKLPFFNARKIAATPFLIDPGGGSINNQTVV